MAKKLQKNINIVYALAFFQMFMVIVAVIVPFFKSKGLSLAEIFYLQAIFAAVIVLFEAPSGYFADVFGRRTALIIGSIAHGVGFLMLNITDDFYTLAIFEIILGLAMSMMSGADLALLYDTKPALTKSADGQGGSIAHLGFLKSCAEGLGALIGGVLALWSFDLMVLVQSVVAWVCLILALQIIEPPNARHDSGRKIASMKEICRHLLQGDKLLRRVFIAIPIYNLVTFHAAWLVQPYWEERGVSLAIFGVLWCAQSLMVAVANKIDYILEQKHGAVFTLVLIGTLPIVGHFGMAWSTGWYGIAICFVLFLGRGLYKVILINALNNRVPSEFRATANSLTSFAFRASFILTGPMVGFLAETRGLTTTLNVLGVASIVMLLAVILPLIKSVKLLERTSCVT